MQDVLALVHAGLARMLRAASLHPGPGMIHSAVVYQANSMQRIGLLIQRGPGISRRGVLFVAAALIIGVAGCNKAAPPPPPAPPEVQVMTVALQDVPIYQEWIGSLDGSTNAQIRAQVSGYLIAQKYKEGSLVKKGDVLFQIDQARFPGRPRSGQGATRHRSRPSWARRELDVKRLTPLAKENAISQEELDDAMQANLAAKASVEAAKATAAQSQLNLDFTDVTSPIDGIAGTAQAQIGDLVGPGSGVLTTVSTIDPMRAYFSISEQSYLDLLPPIHQCGGTGRVSGGDAIATDSFRRLDLSLPRHLVLHQPAGGCQTPAPSRWRACSRTPIPSCAPANMPRCGRRPKRATEPYWCRNEPSRNCKAPIKSRWLTLKTRLASRRSKWASRSETTG